MQFAKQFRERVKSGEITCSVRIWLQPRVKLGGRYGLPPGEIEVLRMSEISIEDVTVDLARKSGFDDVDDLLRVAKHGRGEHIFLVEFCYRGP